MLVSVRGLFCKPASSLLRPLSGTSDAPYFKVVEVGARDGLQNEPTILPTAVKMRLIEKLAMCGFRTIEPTSFVSSKLVPQMSDHLDIMARIDKLPNVSYPVLVPNMKYLRNAIECRVVKDIAVFCSASDGFSRKNVNCSMEDGIKNACEVTRVAREANMKVRGYISCVIGCPYDGRTKSGVVADIAKELLENGCYEISLGDTIGVGGPGSVKQLLDTLISAGLPINELAVHFHDTYGQGLANVLAAIEKGIRVADSSIAGLGGCPFARGATGNLATEDLIYMLHDLGFETGINLEELMKLSNWISARLDRSIRSKVTVAYLAKSRRFE